MPTLLPTPQTSYDRVPYPGSIQTSAHPDRLAVAASLCGMRPPDLEQCRVLELGCGDGVNLFPIAHTLPQSRVVGVDLAPSAVERGRLAARMLGLTNLTLRTGDLTALPDDLGGPFDYVIAHGVYSWVPEPIRDALLAACAQVLSPEGVAYISYNAYPGHHAAQMARDMMLYAAGRLADPAGRIRTARQVLATLAAARPEGEAYGTTLREVHQGVSKVRDEVLFHDALATVSTPVYFHQFVEHSRRHGLQFVSEAEYAQTAAGAAGRDPRMAQAVSALMGMSGGSAGGDDEEERRAVEREQFADFVLGRSFRRTLVCRSGVRLKRTPDLREVFRLRIAADISLVGVTPDGAEQFRTGGGLTLTTDRPLARAALRRLGRIWPRSAPFPELLSGAAEDMAGCAGLEAAPEDQPLLLAEAVFAAYAAGMVELRTRDPAFGSADTDRPVASPLARHQARTGAPLAINLCGGGVPLQSRLVREMVMRLDGTRDRRALVGELTELVIAGVIPPAEAAVAAGDMGGVTEQLATECDRQLQQFARNAMLVGP